MILNTLSRFLGFQIRHFLLGLPRRAFLTTLSSIAQTCILDVQGYSRFRGLFSIFPYPVPNLIRTSSTVIIPRKGSWFAAIGNIFLVKFYAKYVYTKLYVCAMSRTIFAPPTWIWIPGARRALSKLWSVIISGSTKFMKLRNINLKAPELWNGSSGECSKNCKYIQIKIR